MDNPTLLGQAINIHDVGPQGPAGFEIEVVVSGALRVFLHDFGMGCFFHGRGIVFPLVCFANQQSLARLSRVDFLLSALTMSVSVLNMPPSGAVLS
jgi:hypothetical protein